MNLEALYAVFPVTIPFPNGLAQLCEWIGANGNPGDLFTLRPEGEEGMTLWFGFSDVAYRLAGFGHGKDGRIYAVWDDGQGGYPVVNMDSEGVFNFVVASDFVDFLRLLAAGYDIGSESLNVPPGWEDREDDEEWEEDERVNPAFTEWVRTTFSVSIPKNGSEIVARAKKHPDFRAWVEEVCDRYQ